MAEIRSIYTNNRTDGKTERRTTYVDGAAVRRLRTGDQPERQRRQEDRFSVHTARRVKAKERMGLGYGMFLAVALGVAMWVCVGYLKLQADNTARAKNIAALETQDGLQVAEMCASCIVAILPVVLLSIFIKKYLVNGLTFGAVK